MDWDQVYKNAADEIKDVLLRPMPSNGFEISTSEFFNPWDAFDCLYGTYSADFDGCAIDVLTELQEGKWVRSDLGAYMFREILCIKNLCDYGSSPRVCFPTAEFKVVLPDLIDKWREFSLVHWEGEEV